MSGRRRSFTPEYRVEAAHRVIDGNRPVAQVALELNLHENLLHKWVAVERRRMAAAGGSPVPDPGEGKPLSPGERAELVGDGRELRRSARDPGPVLLALVVPLLALPQATHYLLDAWIWKVRPENAAATEAIGLEP